MSKFFTVDVLAEKKRHSNALLHNNFVILAYKLLPGYDTLREKEMNPKVLASFATAAFAATFGFAPSSHAIVITQETDADVLAASLTAGATGLTVTGATLSGQNNGTGAVSSGTYSNASNTYGIGPGVALSTGNVSDYGDGPNTAPGFTTGYGVTATADQETLLDPITGGTFDHFDVTQLDITFDSTTGEVFFLVVFGSEEFDEFVGNLFIDGFGLYLNGVNIASVGGDPVNINHPDMAFRSGTELDGILAPDGNPALLFSGSALATGNTLTFIVADTSDPILDTTVYLSSLGGTEPPPPNGVPEPGTLLLLGLGLFGLAFARRHKN